MDINARQYVGTGFPTIEGKRFADVLLDVSKTTDLSKVTVHLDGLSASLLISAFFNAILLNVYIRNPELLKAVQTEIQWQAEFDFQNEYIRQWLENYKPDNAATGASA